MYPACKTQSDVCTATSDVCTATKYKVFGITNRPCVYVGLTKQPKFAFVNTGLSSLHMLLISILHENIDEKFECLNVKRS